MTMYTFLLQPRFRAFDINGLALAGGRVKVYESGTTTPKTSYSNPELTTANTWPVVLNANGEADIWVAGPYKIIVEDANGVQQYSRDGLYGLAGGAVRSPVQVPGQILAWGTTDGELVNSGLSMTDFVDQATAAINAGQNLSSLISGAWIGPITAVYASATTFTVTTDRTAEFVSGIRVQANCGVDGVKTGTVSSSIYASGTNLTTVAVTWDSGSLTANLSTVYRSNDLPASLCAHAGLHAAGGRDALTPTAIGASIPCECRLTLSGGNLLLSRCNGSRLVIDDAPQTIPLAGVTLAPTGLSANTLYYVYAAMSSGSMILEASTAVPTMDARNGIQVKTGDATRTLVGMAYPLAGPVFADEITKRLVVSYYNRKPKALYVEDIGSRTTTSSSYVEVYTEDRLYFLTWADTAVLIGFKAAAYNPATNKFGLIGIGVDRTSGAIDYLKNLVNSNSYYQMYGGMCAVSLADGYHYTSLIFASDGTSSLNVSGSSPACPTENIAMIWG